MPAGYDAEVAELFRDLRSATTLSESDLAMRLGTRADVVQALEQGALFALPPWAETCRVVNAYGAMLNLDVRPLLRRIYAQLEAGIVELQPKPMPDVPVMAPPDTRDQGFASGNHAAGAHTPNPLDIPWPPQQSPQPQNVRLQPQPGAPQAPRPNLQGAPQPQWPGGPPQSQPQAWPGNQTMPQAVQPGAPPQRQPQPQPAAQPQFDGRSSHQHPHPHQSPAPQAHPQFQPRPQPQPQPQARPAPSLQPQPPHVQIEPEARPVEDFAMEPGLMEPEPEKKRSRPGLLKWGLGALIVSVVAFGLWFALNQAPSPSGASTGQSGTLDPDDPRSRKADKLPTPSGG